MLKPCSTGAMEDEDNTPILFDGEDNLIERDLLLQDLHEISICFDGCSTVPMYLNVQNVDRAV